MLSPICIATLLASKNMPNRCRCPKCIQEKDHQAALDYYRRDLPAQEMFPPKSGRVNDNPN